MSSFKSWLDAARLRTLPLSISGIITGAAAAFYALLSGRVPLNPLVNNQLYEHVEWYPHGMIVLLALLTTIGFQVLSNFANDYGDGVKGTDNNDRIGPQRALQSGAISAPQMKRAIFITAILSLCCAVCLIYVSLGIERLLMSLFFLALGIAAIWAAIKYTVGENAYGYKGLGDVFVFIFFGPVSVMGVFYLITKTLDWWTIFPSLTIGLLSVAVLNLNNMRDLESDRKAGKNTIVVTMGLPKAKLFHYLLISIACGAALVYSCLLYDMTTSTRYYHRLLFLLPLCIFIPLGLHSVKINRYIGRDFDPELKKVALSSFLYAVLIGTAVILFF